MNGYKRLLRVSSVLAFILGAIYLVGGIACFAAPDAILATLNDALGTQYNSDDLAQSGLMWIVIAALAVANGVIGFKVVKEPTAKLCNVGDWVSIALLVFVLPNFFDGGDVLGALANSAAEIIVAALMIAGFTFVKSELQKGTHEEA